MAVVAVVAAVVVVALVALAPAAPVTAIERFHSESMWKHMGSHRDPKKISKGSSKFNS